MTYKCTLVLKTGRNLCIVNLTPLEAEHIKLFYTDKDPLSILNLNSGLSIRQDRVDTIQIEEDN